MKHRLLQDLKANMVNEAATTRERTVLPRPLDLARDIAAAPSDTGLTTKVVILDYADAFMSVPLHPAEQPFNCITALPKRAVQRSRPPMCVGEPETGHVVV